MLLGRLHPCGEIVDCPVNDNDDDGRDDVDIGPRVTGAARSRVSRNPIV